MLSTGGGAGQAAAGPGPGGLPQHPQDLAWQRPGALPAVRWQDNLQEMGQQMCEHVVMEAASHCLPELRSWPAPISHELHFLLAMSQKHNPWAHLLTPTCCLA